MKIKPVGSNCIMIETETGQLIDINDGGKYGLIIKSANFEDEMPVVKQDDTRVTITFKRR